jgi:hypothetical protein
MMRKVVLTGLLLFTSERPMVRAVCATMVCCIMIVNLNYFQPHRNLIVFWVEQLANMSATIKYLFAVVIASGGTDSANGENAVLSPEDADIMGILLIGSDLACILISFFAMVACVLLLRSSIKKAQREEKEQAAEEAPELNIQGSEMRQHQALKKRLSITRIQPMAHRRASRRQETPAANGLAAMFAHANDHVKTKSVLATKSAASGRAFNLKAMVSTAHQEHKVKSTEAEHDESLQRLNVEIAHKKERHHDRLQARLHKRATTKKLTATDRMKSSVGKAPAKAQAEENEEEEEEEEDNIIIEDESTEIDDQEDVLREKLKNSALVSKLKKMPGKNEISAKNLEQMLTQVKVDARGELHAQILSHLHAHKDGGTTVHNFIDWINHVDT